MIIIPKSLVERHLNLLLTLFIYQGIPSAFVSTILLRHQREEKRRLHSRLVLERRPSHMGHVGLRQAGGDGSLYPLASQVEIETGNIFSTWTFIAGLWWGFAANWTSPGLELCLNWEELHTAARLYFPDDKRNILLSIFGLSAKQNIIQ